MPPRAFDFTGARVVVVGAASGLGHATADLVAELGGEVIALDIRETSAGGGRYVPVDLADPASIAAAAAAIDGPVDALCNIAGVSSGSGFSNVDIARINYLGLRTLTEALEPKLAPGAAIVCLSSGATRFWQGPEAALDDFVGRPDYASAVRWLEDHPDAIDGYPFSKRALGAWARGAVARLWARDQVRINLMTPGIMDTGMLDASALIGGREQFAPAIEAAGLRLIQPEDQAWVVAFLASRASSTINGQLIEADGHVR